MEAKEEIRAKINIEDVVGQYVQLKRAGRNFKGLSPFTNEKTPSFMVSPEKHIWHDFSSNKGGDVFSFIMEVEGVDFRTALEILARKAGVDLSQYQTKGDRGLGQKKERLYKLLDLATRFYQQSLVTNQAALTYVFKKRKFNKEIVQQFKIGYAPMADDALARALQKRGYKEQDLRDAGLATTRRGRLGDMFRGRMMVPLCDAQGRVVGFTARLIDEQPNAPKYINTPQTILYDKGRQVFGLHLAKEAIRRADYVVIVEGNLDVLASHQAGVAQVVATAGTAMTEYHLRSLSRLTANVRLAFDSDAAGVAATERAIGIASKLGITLGIITLPEGYKDADELVQSDPDAWSKVTQQPKDAMEWLLGEYAKQHDLKTAEGKRLTTSKAIEIIGQITDPVEQEHYIARLSEWTGATQRAIMAKLTQTEQQPRPALKPTKTKPSAQQDARLYQDHLLCLLLMYPDLRDSAHDLQPGFFAGSMRQHIFAIVQKLQSRQLTDDLLDKLQSDELRVKIKELQLIAQHKYPLIDDSLYYAVAELAKRVKIDAKTKLKDEIAAQMATENEKGRAEKNKIYMQLVKEIEALKR